MGYAARANPQAQAARFGSPKSKPRQAVGFNYFDMQRAARFCEAWDQMKRRIYDTRVLGRTP